MNFILSDRLDQSTEEISRWIEYLAGNADRINENNFIENVFIDFQDFSKSNLEVRTKQEKHIINLNEIKWYRRGGLNFNLKSAFIQNKVEINNEIFKHLKNEYLVSLNFINNLFFLESINKPIDNYISKLEQLKLAKDLNILTPKTIITTDKVELNKFMLQCNNFIITKSIFQGLGLNNKRYNMNINGLTSLINFENYKKLPKYFGPSMFQEFIKKKFDIRIYFLHDSFFCSAILSQSNSQTSIDFRDYCTKRPNRVLPYIIPIYYEKKLKILMKKLNLNSGSIDLVIDDNKKIYFLEVNPVGQFSQVSKPCNYNIEQSIASEIINSKYA
jgi:glutathione synthase/RimK-type ligase-like ATP-grasp enzyme